MTYHLTQLGATVGIFVSVAFLYQNHKMSLIRSLMRNTIKYHQIRLLSTTPVTYEKLATKTVPKHDWNRAVSEAEKIVG